MLAHRPVIKQVGFLKMTFIYKGQETFTGYYQLIKYFNIQNVACGADVHGHIFIRLTWYELSRGMIVCKDDSYCTRLLKRQQKLV